VIGRKPPARKKELELLPEIPAYPVSFKKTGDHGERISVNHDAHHNK
jgi:hypothetical protein